MPTERKPEDAAAVDEAARAVKEATRAMSEAGRASAEATRRAMERQADAAVEIARAYQEELAELNSQLIESWSIGAEANWRAGLELQRAWLGAGAAFLDASARWNRLALQLWEDLSRQMTLEPLKAWTSASQRVTEGLRPDRERVR